MGSFVIPSIWAKSARTSGSLSRRPPSGTGSLSQSCSRASACAFGSRSARFVPPFRRTRDTRASCRVAFRRLPGADAHRLTIAGIRRALQDGEGIEIVGEAHSAPEIRQLIERRRPDLVLLDLRMPGVLGTECIEQVRDTWPEVKIVVLSACAEQST